ncbi:MAG: glycosyltransferase family 4 protein [Desulfamplus sp.]|nr:glycosyltransferase family 4 protein [Desulfamplus sp.]
MASEPFQFLKTLGAGQYSIIHLNPSLQPRSLIRNAVLAVLSKLAGKQVIVFWRGWDKQVEQRMVRPFQRLFRLIFNQADVHLVLAAEFRDNLRDMGISKPILVSSTIADPPADITNLKKIEREEGLRLLFMSRLVKAKGIYQTVEAFKLLKAEFPSLRLDVAGDGLEMACLKKRYFGLHGLTFHGHLEDREKYELIAQSDAFVFPTSHGEGMPNCVLEAMAAGLPVITCPIGGLRDFFCNEVHGFFLKETDPLHIAETTAILLRNEILRHDISENNKNYARIHFSSSNIVTFLTKLYLATFEKKFDSLQSEWFADAIIE